MPYSRIEEIISKYGRALGLTARTTLPEWTAALQQLSAAKTREAQIASSPEIKTRVEQELADIKEAAQFVAQFDQQQSERQKKVLQKLRQAVQAGDPNLLKLILAEPADQEALPKEGQPAFIEYLGIQNEAKAKWPDIAFSTAKPEARTTSRPAEAKAPPHIARRQNVLKKLRQALQASDRNLFKWMLSDQENKSALPKEGEPLHAEYMEIQKEAVARWPEITFPNAAAATSAPAAPAPAPVSPLPAPAPRTPAPAPAVQKPAAVVPPSPSPPPAVPKPAAVVPPPSPQPAAPKPAPVMPPPAAPPPAAAPQGSKGVIIAVVAVIVIAAGGAVFMFSGKPAPQPITSPAPRPAPAPAPPVVTQAQAPKPAGAPAHMIKIAVWSKPRGTVFVNDRSSNQKTDGWFDVPTGGAVKVEVQSPGYFSTNNVVQITDTDNDRRVINFGSLEPSGLAPGERDHLETLRVLAFEVEHAATSDQRRALASQYMDESAKFVKRGGNLIDVWTFRAKMAIELNMQAAATEAGQKLQALGPDNANDPGTTAVVNALKLRGWL